MFSKGSILIIGLNLIFICNKCVDAFFDIKLNKMKLFSTRLHQENIRQMREFVKKAAKLKENQFRQRCRQPQCDLLLAIQNKSKDIVASDCGANCNQAYSRIRFTNVVCKNLDPSYVIFERCKLVAVSRDANYFTVKAVLLQVPVTDFELRIQIMKKANGWKPFLYDVTIKCNFTKKLNPVSRLLWNAIKNISNIKHDCPYNQNLEALNFSNAIIEEAFKRLPVPQGEYAFFTTWKAYNVTRAILNFYGVLY